MRNKTKATFFPKLSFPASFPTLPPWRAQWDGDCHQFITLYFCHSFLLTPFSCPSMSASQGTILHKLLQCDCPHKVQCLNNHLFDHGSPMSCKLLPENQLVCRLLSTGCSFCQEPAPGDSPWAAAFFRADPLPVMGSSMGCRVDLPHGLPMVDLHGLKKDKQLNHDLLHWLQGKLCSHA